MPTDTSAAQALIDRGAAHHQAGRFDSARQAYEQALDLDPANGEAMALLGLLYRAEENLDRAIEMLERAVDADPSWWSYYNDLGEAYVQQGRLDEALAALQRAVELNPRAFQPHLLLGLVYAATKRPHDAIAEYEHAVDLEPNNAEAWHALGNARHAVREFGPAEEAQRKALDLKIVYPEAEQSLGLLLHLQGREDEADSRLETALGLRPDDPAVLAAVANVQFRRKKYAASAKLLQRAVELKPGEFQYLWSLWRSYWHQKDWKSTVHVLHTLLELQPMLPSIWFLYGQAMRAAGTPDAQVKETMQRALDLGLNDPPSRFIALAVVGGHAAHTPGEIVADLFDEYAGNFEDHLVKGLQYQGHTMLHHAVMAVGVTPPLDLLDAGCGTGLCGDLFKPMCRRLIGVDLAPKMIEKSRSRGIYDELILGDASASIRKYPDSLDVILAGDVLIYIGEPDEIFGAAAMALRDGGVFAFTIETNPEEGIRLMRTQRYQHSLAYLRACAQKHGLRELHASSHVLRIEAATPVPGHAVVIGKR